jgi:hypothetical protein
LKEPGRFISARAYALKARPSVLDVINVHSLRSDETNVLTNDITCQPHGTQAPWTPSLCQRTGNGLYPAPLYVEVLDPGRICRNKTRVHCYHTVVCNEVRGVHLGWSTSTANVLVNVDFSHNALRGYKHKVCMRSISKWGLARVHVSVVSCLRQHFVSY